MISSFIHVARDSRRRRRYVARVLALFVAIGAPSALVAQDSTMISRTGWAVGPSVGMPGDAHSPYYPLATIGVSATRLHLNHPGVDFSLGTAPMPFIVGFPNVAARGGLALPLAFGPALLLPSVGVSALSVGSIDGGGGSATFGYNVGAAAIVPTSASSGIRMGMTWHRFHDSADAIWLLELGVVRIPRRE